MKLTRLLFYFLLLQTNLVISQSSAVTEVPMDIAAKDGTKLKATYYSPGKPGPGMMLFHQCDNDRKSWDAVAKTFASYGIHVLTFDYRGFGETPAAGGMWLNINSDIEDAFNALQKLPGVNGKFAAGGASCGVVVSLRLAAQSKKVTALMLLSGPRSDDQVEYFKQNKNIVLFTAVTDKDRAAESIRKTVEQLNPKNQIIVVQNGPSESDAHGIGIFREQPSLIRSAAEFLTNALK